MTDLIAYCPEIARIRRNMYLQDYQKQDLIAAALIREIKRRGEWFAFECYCINEWSKVPKMLFTKWLTDPSTLIRVAGEWVKSKGEIK